MQYNIAMMNVRITVDNPKLLYEILYISNVLNGLKFFNHKWYILETDCVTQYSVAPT